MPRSGAASTVRRKASAPARWPAIRGSPRAVAQRPFPSMIIAACKPREVLCDIKCVSKKRGLQLAHRLNQCFHVIEIFFKRAASHIGQTILGLWHAALKRLGAADIIGLLQLARMHAKVSIGSLEQFLEFVECERSVRGQGAHDS